MKTQITLRSFAATSFEVLPVVIPDTLESAAESSGPISIDWLGGLPCRRQPARRLPGSTLCIQLVASRTVRLTGANAA